MPTTINTNSFQTPTATNLDRESISIIAEGVAEKLEYITDADIYKVVEELGGEVCFKDFWAEGSKESGSLEARDKDDFTIFIPFDTSEIRDRFTIAHELGHYFLHFLWPRQVLNRENFKLRASRYGSDRAEWEANWFASAFLMPSDEFKRLADSENYSLGQLSRHFSVSLKAADIRAKVLEVDVKS